MRAAIYYGPRDVRMEDRPTPVAGPTDAVVKIARAGICGTDLTAYLYSGDAVAIFEGGEFGHEMVGTVCEVGADVADVKVGDRVFVCPTTCKRGGMGLADSAGGFSEYVLVEDAKLDYNLYKLDDGVTFDEAVVTEPFAVGTRGKNVAGVRPGDHAVVFGAGPIGLAALSSLVGMGIRDAVVVDVNDERLARAKQMGAGAVCNSQTADLAAFLSEHFGTVASHIGMPVPDVDAFIDCAGAPSIAGDFLAIAKEGARLSVVAVYKQPVELNLTSVMSSEAVIMGSCGYSHADIEEVLANLASRTTKMPDAVTHHFPHEQTPEAFACAADPSTGAVKVVIDYE